MRGERIGTHHRVGIAPLDPAFEPAQDRALCQRDHRGHRLVRAHGDRIGLFEIRRTVEHHAEVGPPAFARQVLEDAEPQGGEPALDADHELGALRTVATGKEHARRAPRQLRQAKPAQMAAQLRQVRAQRLPVPGARRVGDHAPVALIAPAPCHLLERSLRLLVPQVREPERARLAKRGLFHCVDQPAGEEHIRRHALFGTDREPRRHETRMPDFIVPGEYRAPRGAAWAIELDEAKVQVLREARHEFRQSTELARRHGELQLLGRALRKAVRVPDQAKGDALGAQALEKSLRDVAALFHLSS